MLAEVAEVARGKGVRLVACASGLWLDVGRDCDAFLVGSDSRFWQMRSNNLLFGESIWALKQLNYQRFILGGGPEPLFRFKRSFSNNTIRCNKFESHGWRKEHVY
jgi:hypothetical protein